MNTSKRTYAVVRAVYNNHNARDDFERELDLFLSRKVDMVIIEPESLGEVTWRWIQTGNWLHKTAVFSGFSALAVAGVGTFWKSLQLPLRLPLNMDLGWLNGKHAEMAITFIIPHFTRIGTTLFSAVSVMSAGVYALLWQWDPCCKYQVASSLASLPRGMTSVVACNGKSHHTTGLDSEFNTPPGAISNGNSPNSSGGYSRVTTQNGGTRPRPVIMENSIHLKGPPLRPVVLIRRDDTRRKLLHNSLAVTSLLVTGYAIHQWFRVSVN